MTGPALLDVNVLIALFDAEHVHHEIAHDWFAGNRPRGWATCPLTENALVRIVSNPRYGSNAERPRTVAARLHSFRASGGHHFWPAAVSLAEESRFDLSFASHRQLTDVYLLALAKEMEGVLATFDRTIPLKAVIGATADLLDVIGA